MGAPTAGGVAMKDEEHQARSRGSSEREERAAWGGSPPRPVFVALSCSGPDPAIDDVHRIRAIRDGEGFDRSCEAPAADGDQGEIRAIWTEFERFAAGSLVVAAHAETFEAWAAHLAGRRTGIPAVCGLSDVAALLFPGRLAHRREGLVLEFCATDSERARDAEPTPENVREALGELTRRFLALDDAVIGAIAGGLDAAWGGLSLTDPEGARRIEQVLSLVEHRGRWSGAETDAAREGELSARELVTGSIDLVVEELDPRWTVETKAWAGCQPLPPMKEEPLPFHEEDLALLDAVFTEHLPAIFAEETGEDESGFYRASQHDVAREIAATLGAPTERTQLLLVHAPTGTGKTLAYLLPALLWARRHELRVGIATYTRTLQEQAMDRELPRALQALRRAGALPGFRVTMLKGRENYLCWRALRLSVPEEEASGEEWLAYTQLLAFALTDGEGDLNRLPHRPPVEMSSSGDYRRVFRELLRDARAQTGCCRHKDDRARCGAEVVRRRAERSHLVITNHSFVLARQEFLRHIVFDECEHLHDQAHAAYSHSVELREVRRLLDRIDQPTRGRSRSLFQRIGQRLVPGTRGDATLAECRQRWIDLERAHDGLLREVNRFLRWREEARRERSAREDHSLLREYAESEEGAYLVAARLTFSSAGGELDRALAEMDERLENLGKARLVRLRRSLDLARTDLLELLEGIEAWLPVLEGKPRFNPRTFHDVEVEPGGGTELAARVLLPNEYLGSIYYPQLSSAIFLSATTWLKGGFEAAQAYLGLDRAVHPLEDEEREPCVLRTFRGPEVFDYGRVLVAVPRDAPAIARDKEAFLHYVRDFLAALGERTRGRILALFTNSNDVKQVGARLEGFFHARRIPFWYQNMPGTSKEELSEMFLARVDSVLLGVDTFWYGADFPGKTLEYLVIVRLPYGVPDRYHHAQCATLGISEQRRQIYMPRALAKFRQGFGRLMRKITDRGCVFLLDGRVLDPRHRVFHRELPVAGIGSEAPTLARLVRGDTDYCIHQALVHMGIEEEGDVLPVAAAVREGEAAEQVTRRALEALLMPPEFVDVPEEELPF